MREIVLDTETTGLDPDDGHRVVEIGCIELVNHMPTRRVFHTYLNPERDMPEDAFRITGLSAEFLRDKPLFESEARRFLEFIGDAPLVIHNAKFDIAFLNSELRRAGFAPLPDERAVCTATMARTKYPGAPASLDALCKRFGVDNSRRQLHGAMLDCELLAEVYLHLIGGRQPGLALAGDAGGRGDHRLIVRPKSPRPEPLPPRLSAAERAAHEAFVSRMKGDVVWSWEPHAAQAAE